MSATAIAALAARIARVPEAEADPSMPFALMGLDSAGTIELAIALEEMLGVDLPPDVVAECADARSVAARVASIPTRLRDASEDPFAEMIADAALPDAVHPRIADVGTPPHALCDARRILLTGATGFLGRWLAKALLERSDAAILCLVRGGREQPRARLQKSLASAGVDVARYEARIGVVEGDLARPSLGMNRRRLDEMSDEVDAICHAGAAVNWALAYRALAAVNVRSTRDLLEVACRRSTPFHFVSSLSVCYSTVADEPAGEGYDALEHIRGLHLGYAQTKSVAEALVREASRRGLPATIYRPSFIAGHSVNGAFNHDDILARVVSGCVRMGAAPDLEWSLDCLPVDVAAAGILELSGRRGVVHLAHPQPRHWRECVLWMRLYGYDVRLVPYHAWLRQLERDTDADRSHPLRPLRGFLLNRPANARGLTLPELMLRTDLPARTGTSPDAASPDLDASLLQRYFDAFVEQGALPATSRSGISRSDRGRPLPSSFFADALHEPIVSAEPLGRLSNHSIIGELTDWRAGRSTGLFGYRLRTSRGEPPREVVVKIKPADEDVIAVGAAVARLCDPEVGRAFECWRNRLGFSAGHVRELAVYRQTDPRFVRHAPRALATVADATTGTWLVVLERIENGLLRDSVDQPHLWNAAHVTRAIEGLAALHSVWYEREADLRAQDWIGYVSCGPDVEEMTDLWRALASHAGPRFAAWADPSIVAIQRKLIARIPDWRRRLDEQPRTLIHNDFNPRNICLRPGEGGPALCAYDWELATVGAPQRDLAELLCFVLGPDVDAPEVEQFVDLHRRHLGDATGGTIDRTRWHQGFQASLCDLMLNRLPMYALVHRIRRQTFLPRVVRTWRRLYELYPLA